MAGNFSLLPSGMIIGCKATVSRDDVCHDGIIVALEGGDSDSCLWILDDKGKILIESFEYVTVNMKDFKLIYGAKKKAFQSEKIDRFKLMEIENE